jgi:hypothetical protein
METRLTKRGRGRELAVVLHGPHGSPKQMQGVLQALEERSEDIDIFAPSNLVSRRAKAFIKLNSASVGKICPLAARTGLSRVLDRPAMAHHELPVLRHPGSASRRAPLRL